MDRSRWLWAALCVAFAGLMLACGWLVPMHLRAVDGAVLRLAGGSQPSLVERGQSLQKAGNPEAARLILRAAQDEKLPWTSGLASSLAAQPGSEPLFPGGPSAPADSPVTTQLIRMDNRQKALDYLQSTGSPAVRELLRARDLTNTVLFTPSQSSSGQAFDAAISITGLLLEGNFLAPGLRDAVVDRAAMARTRATAQPLEEILLDVMSLGQRLDWGQLTVFAGKIDSPETLASLAEQARNAGARWPELFAVVALSERPGEVAGYLREFSQTGLDDLSAGLRYGEGGLDELLRRHERLFNSPRRQRWTASGPMAPFFRAGTDYALRISWFALIVKWFFYISGGFLLAAAGHCVWPALVEEEELLRVRGFHVARELLFAMGFLLVVLLLSEPFLAQDSQKEELTFRLRLPMAGAAAGGKTPLAKTNVMNARSLFTLALFFVLQALLYCACLIKLAEIRRQKVPARVQIKLLENEEHLFDGGLYLGFAGTIICLILVSLGIIQQSLMAAYSSTSFGVIFVSIFKIFNLRPVRRRLLLQAEAPPAAPETSTHAAPSLAA